MRADREKSGRDENQKNVSSPHPPWSMLYDLPAFCLSIWNPRSQIGSDSTGSFGSYAFAVGYSDVLTEPQEALAFYRHLGWDCGVVRCRREISQPARRRSINIGIRRK